MTCVIGLVDNDTVYMGADSAGVAGLSLSIRADEKVFIRNGMIFGFTSSFRMGQILRYSFSPPAQTIDQDDYAYLCGPWVDSLISCLKDKGFARVDNNEVRGGFFLIGFRGKLYHVEADFQVGRRVDVFDAVGCGQDLALGALHVLEAQKLSPRKKIEAALRAAERFSAGVKGPFHVLKLIGEK